MLSLKALYKIGPGPSSSHTIAPWRACLAYKEAFPLAEAFTVTLYGSLARTGKGHLTDQIIIKTFAPSKCEVIFKPEKQLEHPLTFTIIGSNQDINFDTWQVISLGGGDISINGKTETVNDVYKEKSFAAIKEYLQQNSINLYEYVFNYEPDLPQYLEKILHQMLKVVDEGLKAAGILPGRLKLMRVAKELYLQSEHTEAYSDKTRLKIMSYAYAASEENAAGNVVVTAPTLGASGVLPAIIRYYYDQGVSRRRLINALAVAGVFGNLIKHNATISGAVGGCQAEIGTACSMASAAVAYLEGLNVDQIEAAAEIGMEHHLGLTCDPVGGYVMIPCIERNAIAAVRALDGALLARSLLPIRNNRISFDMIVETMKYTGNKIAIELKETALGGLAMQVNLENVE